MNFRILVITIIITTISSIKVTAQNADSLLGKWKAIYVEEGRNYTVIYEFKKVNNTIQAFSFLVKDETGEELKDESLVISKIKFNNGKGTCIYTVKDDDEVYEIKSELLLEVKNTLKLSYSYWGFSDTEIWKRVE